MLFVYGTKRLGKTELLANHLLYGMYPEVTKDSASAADYLLELTDADLMKDLLQFDGVKHAGKLVELLRLLVYQIGSEASLPKSWANNLRLSKNTVTKYLDLLSKDFVIFKLPVPVLLMWSKNLEEGCALDVTD